MKGEGTEAELHQNILKFKNNIPDPNGVNLIFQEDLTAEEIVDKGLNYKPFHLKNE